MNENDIYFNEHCDANPQLILRKVYDLLEQMRNRPLGHYYVRRWPVIFVEKNFEDDTSTAYIQARMTCIQPAPRHTDQLEVTEFGMAPKITINQEVLGNAPKITINQEVLGNAIAEENALGARVSRPQDSGEAHGAGLPVRSRWRRAIGFLFGREVWKERWRTVREFYHQVTGR